jgi:hypothetical protein
VISEVALNYANDVSTVVAKIDASKNEIDHSYVKIRGFPTLYLFKANDKYALLIINIYNNNYIYHTDIKSIYLFIYRLSPIEYDGDRTTESIVSFIDSSGMTNYKRIAREEIPLATHNSNKDFTHIVEEL